MIINIYNSIEREFSVKLKLHKVRRREPSEFVQRGLGLTRITKNEWIQK